MIKVATNAAVLIEDGGWADEGEIRQLLDAQGALIYFLGTHFVTRRLAGEVHLGHLTGRPGAQYWLPIVRQADE